MSNMKFTVIILYIAGVSTALSQARRIEDESECNADVCKLPDCKCSDTNIPNGLDAADVPQLVYLTFDDAVNVGNIDFYRNAFANRTNPDGCSVQATFYISHEYSDYANVHELYAGGHEIALHSITHQSSTDYWRKISEAELMKEFGGERELVAAFANVPAAQIKGMRLPLLQLSGENSFRAAQAAGLAYDCSWPTLSFVKPGMWPYTLDYTSKQDCGIPPCPIESIPGFWVQPMLDLRDEGGTACSMVDACTNVTDTVDAIFAFLKTNFERSYLGNRAPFGVYMHAAWFGKLEHAFEAYVQFIDYLQTLSDVYLVGVERGLEWVRHPRRLGEPPLWPSCQVVDDSLTCAEQTTCKLMKGNEERYMKICGASCPNVYPWLGNPLGQ